MENVLTFIDDHKEQFVETLREAVAIPSISGLPEHKEDVLRMKDWLRTKIEDLGFTNLQESAYGGYPVIYAERIVDPNAPTILIYGHYDVQPVDPLELWDSSPFELVEEDGKLKGRGSIDDKGMMLTHLFAMKALKESGVSPNLNIKLCLEGEEESGGEEIEKFIRDNKELLKTDVVFVSDTYMVKDGVPGITNALRGIVYFDIELKGARSDLHSGVYGGSVPNPANILTEMLASLKDENQHITIPGFYDDVEKLSQETREMFTSLDFSDEEYKEDLEISDTRGEEGFTTLERRWARPTLDVHGLTSGFSGEGAKTVIPNIAKAKFSCRLVPHQNAKDITTKIKSHLEAICPDSVKMTLTPLHGGDPWYIAFDHPAFSPVKKAIKQAFGREPVGLREGGSIPVVETFSTVLEVPCILLALGNPNNNAHAPNEWYDKETFITGIKSNAWLYQTIAEEGIS